MTIDRAVLNAIDASHGPAVGAWASDRLDEAEAVAAAVLHRALRADAGNWNEWMTDALVCAQLTAAAVDAEHDLAGVGAGDVLRRLADTAAAAAVTEIQRNPPDPTPSRIFL